MLNIHDCFNGSEKRLTRDALMKQVTGPFQISRPLEGIISSQLALHGAPKMVKYNLEVEVTVRESLTLMW